MAGYYPLAIVALSMIYSHTADAKPEYIFCTADINSHLLEEKEPPNAFARNSPDSVVSLTDKQKRDLCTEVAPQLIGEECDTLLGDGDVAEPEIAKNGHPLISRDVRIEELDMSKPMFWCRSRKFMMKVPESHLRSRQINPEAYIGQIEGFFCAGSSTNDDRVYVFRTRNNKADKVKPVAELNNWSPSSE